MIPWLRTDNPIDTNSTVKNFTNLLNEYPSLKDFIAGNYFGDKKYTLEKNMNPENMFKLYTWRKEWVRPYESIYSILRNFCKVNVFQGSYAKKVLDVKGYSTGLPVPKIMMFNKSTQSERNFKKIKLYNT